jgi:hypothetical protein
MDTQHTASNITGKEKLVRVVLYHIYAHTYCPKFITAVTVYFEDL